MFRIFVLACKRYKFTYTLYANNGLTLTLHPNNTFYSFSVKQEYYNRNYFKLFYEAIKKMRLYRRENAY